MELTLNILVEEAREFSRIISSQNHPSILGVTDGKKVGTYVEHLFKRKIYNDSWK